MRVSRSSQEGTLSTSEDQGTLDCSEFITLCTVLDGISRSIFDSTWITVLTAIVKY
jgi:hypothetical protein